MFSASFNDKIGCWCVVFDKMHVCRAFDQMVAMETAALLQASRKNHYSR